MKREFALRVYWFLLIGILLAAASGSAQTIAYRRTLLTSDLSDPGFVRNVNPSLRNPWGIAFVPGFPFYIANFNNGRVIGLDATGATSGPGGFVVPNAAETGPGAPFAMVADPDSLFVNLDSIPVSLIEIITATQDGGIYFWEVDSEGIFPTVAKLVVDHSQLGAVYTGIAIMKPDCCAPFLAVANFHTGLVEAYSTDFAPLGTFRDPSLPDGYAPYGMQVIGNQLFIAFAMQDAAKHDPVIGTGNGIVSVFNMEGRFLRRFATAGTLNAPWGMTQASANFGPFSNDILIANTGDGVINAFDPLTGNLDGQIKDGDGNVIISAGLHALTFRSDGFADPDTLYFTVGILGEHGIFGTITTGLVSTTSVSVQPATVNNPAPVTVRVTAGPGNPGTPEGKVSLQVVEVPFEELPLVNGEVTATEVFTTVGTHAIGAQYEGDDVFLPSFGHTEVEVTNPITLLVLTAPPSATPRSTVMLTATIHSDGGTPTGQIVFHDGNSELGTASLDAAGVATLLVNNLTAGAHTLSVSYAGDGQFGASTSAPVTTIVSSKDFSLDVTPPAANVVAGQSVLFNIAVTPAGGFVDPVTFSCAQIAGITCTFNPPMVTPSAGVVTTMLTVTTSAAVRGYGQNFDTMGPGLVLASLGFLGVLAFIQIGTPRPRAAFLKLATGGLALTMLALTLTSCGGNNTSVPTPPSTTSLIQVSAHSASISRTTTISVIVQ